MTADFSRPLPGPAVLARLLALLSLALPLGARAADAPALDTTGSTQVIQPEVLRRPVRVPQLPGSNDIELGLFAGTHATQSFGTSAVGGARLGYHLSEDFFVEASYGRTRVSDEVFRQVLPGGVFAGGSETLTWQDLSLGVHLLPGEVFIGRHYARPSAFFLLAGAGTTRFNQQRLQTMVFGLGSRVQVLDWLALRLDMRDHLYSMDLLGKRQSTHNLDLSLGLSLLF